MNRSTASAQRISGHYIAVYSPTWTTGQETVTDAHGEPVQYRTKELATIAAYEAPHAAEEARYRHWNGVEQKQPVERWYNLSTRKRAQQQDRLAREAQAVFRKAAE